MPPLIRVDEELAAGRLRDLASGRPSRSVRVQAFGTEKARVTLMPMPASRCHFVLKGKRKIMPLVLFRLTSNSREQATNDGHLPQGGPLAVSALTRARMPELYRGPDANREMLQFFFSR